MTVREYTREEIQANREAWLTALETGSYRQGKGTLRYADRYCCLGVACEVVPTVAGIELKTHVGETSEVHYYGEENHHGSLPREVRTPLGLGHSDPYVRMPNGSQHEVSHLNDGLRMTFPEIAAVIREQGDDWDGTYQQPVD